MRLWFGLFTDNSLALPNNRLVRFNRILRVHLLRIDAGHGKAAMAQQALYVEEVHTVADGLGGECTAYGVCIQKRRQYMLTILGGQLWLSPLDLG